MSIVILGIYLGKNSCSIVGLDANGAVIVRRRMRRDGVIAFAAKLKPCTMAMEACCGAHHMGRSLAGLGHEVRLMSPEYVRPYVKAQKNDDRDAEAIAEAATRPNMRFVELKSEEQLDVQTLHRVRDRLVGDRTPNQPDQEPAAGTRSRRGAGPRPVASPARRTAGFRRQPVESAHGIPAARYADALGRTGPTY